VAIERIFVKQVEQVEIRFPSWEGSRMMPRALDLPEEELLPLIRAAIREGVFSEAFMESLRSMVGELKDAEPQVPRELTDLDRVQAHFHALIRSRAGDLLREHAKDLPILAVDVAREDDPVLFPIEGMLTRSPPPAPGSSGRASSECHRELDREPIPVAGRHHAGHPGR
jgi:hypothetical protein